MHGWSYFERQLVISFTLCDNGSHVNTSIPLVKIKSLHLFQGKNKIVSSTDLPHELLREIFKDLMPDGLEPFCLACKHIYNSVSQSLLPKHKRYKQDYTCIEVRGARDIWQERYGYNRYHVIQLLHDIERDPVIAKYIRWASLDNRDCEYEGPQLDTIDLYFELDFPKLGPWHNSLFSDIFNSPYLHAAGQDPRTGKPEPEKESLHMPMFFS